VPGIGVIVNPHARGNRRDAAGRVARMEKIVGAQGLVRATPTLEAIEQAAREFRERGIDILGICGGDGSDQCTLTAFERVYDGTALPMLLPLRAGTINYIADDIGGRRGTPEHVLQQVVQAHRRGHPHVTTERDVLRVNGEQLGFVLSFGTAVNFLRVYYARDTQGPVWAARLLGRAIVSAALGTHLARSIFQAVEADITCDDEPLPFRQFPFFFAATVRRIALGFQPTYLGDRKRGFCHVVGGPVPARRLIRYASRVHRGYPTNEPLLYDNLCRRLTIWFAKPTHYMLDGDIVGPTDRLDVEVYRRLTFVRE
jgi:diacylglycerol kinase family enzyme